MNGYNELLQFAATMYCYFVLLLCTAEINVLLTIIIYYVLLLCTAMLYCYHVQLQCAATLLYCNFVLLKCTATVNCCCVLL